MKYLNPQPDIIAKRETERPVQSTAITAMRSETPPDCDGGVCGRDPTDAERERERERVSVVISEL